MASSVSGLTHILWILQQSLSAFILTHLNAACRELAYGSSQLNVCEVTYHQMFQIDSVRRVSLVGKCSQLKPAFFLPHVVIFVSIEGHPNSFLIFSEGVFLSFYFLVEYKYHHCTKWYWKLSQICCLGIVTSVQHNMLFGGGVAASLAITLLIHQYISNFLSQSTALPALCAEHLKHQKANFGDGFFGW